MKKKRIQKTPLMRPDRELLPVTHFALDRNGTVRNIDENIKQHLGWNRREMIGKNIKAFLLPVGGKTLNKLFQEFTECGNRMHKVLFCLMKRPEGKRRRDLIVYLIADPKDTDLIHGVFTWPLSNLVPLHAKSHMIASSSEESYVFLHKEGRIHKFGSSFLADAGISATNLRSLAMKPLASLIEPHYVTPDWLSHRSAIQYMSRYARDASGTWKLLYHFPRKSSEVVKGDFLFNTALQVEYEDGVLLMRSKNGALGSHYAILNIPVNLPLVDLRIEYECSSPNPADLSAILGGNNFGYGLDPDDCGYFFGFGCRGQVNTMQRKFVSQQENKALIPRPDQWYKCMLERVGGKFLFKVNGKVIFDYIDPQPIFGPYSQYFSFYFYSKSAKFRNLRVCTRKSTFDYEKLHRINQCHIVFKNNPGKMFEMRWMAGFQGNQDAQLVLFKDISHQMDISTQKRLRGTVATRTLLERARSYIAENFHRQISFKELCKDYHMSRGFFFTIFKNAYGVSPKDYQVGLRMERAKQMLVSGQYKIKEVALLNGYENERNFNRTFLMREGMTPSAFAQKNKI